MLQITHSKGRLDRGKHVKMVQISTFPFPLCPLAFHPSGPSRFCRDRENLDGPDDYSERLIGQISSGKQHYSDLSIGFSRCKKWNFALLL